MEKSQLEKFKEVMVGKLNDKGKLKGGFTEIIHSIVSDLHDQGYKQVEPKLIKLIEAWLNTEPIEDIVNTFIENSTPFWEQIKKREENFFVDNLDKVFEKLPYKDEINKFSKLFTMEDEFGTRVLCEEDLEDIWEFMESLVRISIVYIHQGRKPAIRLKEGSKAEQIYTKEFFKDIKLRRIAKEWDIELKWKD